MAGRGGRRQGTPGKTYSNRTDLSTNMAPQQGLTTAAAGGMTPPAPAPQQGPPPMTPEQTPNLFDPGTSGLPLTHGLPTGAGAGPPAPGAGDIAIIQKYLPDLKAAAQLHDAPPSFVALVQFLQGGGVK